MPIRGVVFDLNGTLFWDTGLHNRAWDLFLEESGITLTDLEKNQKIHGKNNKDILNGVFARSLSPETLKTYSERKEAIYQRLCLQTDMQLAPGAQQFLMFLSNRRIAFTIATASELGNVEFYFARLGLGRYFDRSRVVYNDGTFPSKPNPQIFQRAIEVLGIDKSETLIFEDSISGIQAAENAGAAKIIIVDSNGDDHSRWNYQIIRSFADVDTAIFDATVASVASAPQLTQ